MPAYVINHMQIHDAALFEQYKQLSPPSVAQYGGRFVVRGGAIDVLEGDWCPARLVIIEFPDADRARAWAESPEYAPAKRLRQQASTSNLVLVQGVAP